VFDSRCAPLALPADVATALAAAYAEPQRAYHTAEHISDVLGWFESVADHVGWREPAEVYVAIMFHDAIYVPGAQDNEARSAAWAREAMPMVDGARVESLILLTARHGRLDPADVRGDRDAALFLDSDMAILAATPAAFDAYDAAVAVEYKAVPPDAYRAGRLAFLEGLAAKPRIFLSAWFHDHYDDAARANLARAISRLR
jgi:predicted metal-dependent HD superfamily phosphohydrolase